MTNEKLAQADALIKELEIHLSHTPKTRAKFIELVDILNSKE